MKTTAWLLSLFAIGWACIGQTPPKPVWKFAVSGDSRNCGDVVMPAIAAGVAKAGAEFYWHLGDFRAIYAVDEDIVPRALPMADYLSQAWPDFIDHQLGPFGKLEVFLGIGNHEVIRPKTREGWVAQFQAWLDSPRLRAQRNTDHDTPGARPYFHWVMKDSVDFITLDNAGNNSFDAAQMEWIRARLAADSKASAITTIVVGMHEALPGSKGLSHSMCDSPAGVASGREVYELLWKLRQAGKKVYVLASHSHFVMDDVYRTSYWGEKVLPGWIIGTAGAVRYRLPKGVAGGTIARTDTYGYLVATVMSDGSVQFGFQEVGPAELRAANAGKATDALLQWCVAENKDQRDPVAGACGIDGK